MGKSTAALAALLAAACWLTPPPASAACAGKVNGPCASPDPTAYLPGRPDLVLTNFGLLFPGEQPGQWQVVCDDNFGLTPPGRIRRAPDGRIFAASNMGLYVSAGGCSWGVAAGAINGEIVFDVAFDPQRPNRVWALGKLPRVLWLSEDGGQTFVQRHAFADTLPFQRLVVAPSDGNRIYLFGRGREAMTPAAASADGGATFQTYDVALGATVPPRISFEFLAVAPDDPAVLYFLVIDPEGDQIWKSGDGGRTIAPVLTLAEKDAFGGIAFGSSASVVYVGGYDPFPLGAKPAGRLYISRNGGAGWEPPLASAPTGPRYRCLASAPGKLYACGAGEAAGDAFMVGVSTDEGRSWTPEVKMTAIYGAKSCVRSQCVRTEVWLCDTYRQCPDGPHDAGPDPIDGPADGPAPVDGPTPPADAGATDARPGDACTGAACADDPGCSCTLGGPPAAGGPAGLLMAAVALALRGRRRRRRPPRAWPCGPV
jgi:MYXO-CTERM domain-containing protein